MREAFDLVEADGTRIAVIGCRPDAVLILAALNTALDTEPVA
jgi:hypothetical protein